VNAKQTSTGITQFVRALCAQGCADQSDGQLLSQFLSRRDEAAFVALVRRHGPMVLGVCRRVLGNAADAEDAFQATFLVLVRKAPALTTRPVLGDWLHGVARRTALSARRAGARRRAKEQAMARPNVQDETVQNDWLPLLDEELGRLPEKYRLPVVLCDLEGKTRKEAAERLGWPEGTVAGRLSRGRALLARHLARQAGAVSSAALAAVLAQNAASACVAEALVHSTARAASLLAAGSGAATAVLSTRVAALTQGVVRAMFLAKLKTLTCVLALTVLVGLGGMALVPGSGPLSAAGKAATPPKQDGDAKPDAMAQKLVGQLGSTRYADRQAAQKALTSLGAQAAAAVQAGMKNADPEIAKRCAEIWPKLWQTEIARPDAQRLAGYTHPLWARFRKAAGDDPGSRTLFAEMVADVKRFSRLEAVEADPRKAGAAYTAELKLRAEALDRGYQEASDAAGPMTGLIVPKSGFPTRSEFVTLLFLGTYPTTAGDEGAGNTHFGVFVMGINTTNMPAFRRLWAAWLGTRTDPQPIALGMRLAVYHGFSEAFPKAVAHAANDKLAPTARGFALLAVGRFGSAADLPLLEKAFADARVFHQTNYHSKDGKQQPVEVRVSDTAVAAALHLAGQKPADFGFSPFLKMYGWPANVAWAEHYSLGFLDDAARQAAYQKARAWLDKQRKEKPRPQP
jgi:RNA polymerase sigma factor (sigma-70 family)